MEPTGGIKAWQWVVTIIVIIVLIIIGVMVFGNKKTDTTMTEENTPSETDVTSAEGNRVVISDQFPGNVVFVSSVSLANGGWVEIHKDNNGTPGAYIGSMYYDSGTNPGGKITLSASTVEGGTYYAMLHSDDGDKKFDATKDLPLKDSRGNIIMKLFHATAAAGAGIKG
ncbi:MAG: hypothetical protein RL536_587 [Candidatus Parcubacteria bacterium]